MGFFRAIASAEVDELSIRSLLNSQGFNWDTSSHVTATASLARSVRKSGRVGLPIATLTDLIIQPGMPDALSLDEFPDARVLTASGANAYDSAVMRWQQLVVGRRIRVGIKFEDQLREFARSVVSNPEQKRLLVKSRRELFKSIHRLIASGVDPAELSPADQTGRLATSAWAWLEGRIPELAVPRQDLWMDHKEFKKQDTLHARSLRARIDFALDRAFGPAGPRRVLIHHGFYFYTPPQWALFQILRSIPEIDQIFIVHDDGSNPAFETWRRFFSGRWDMPIPERIEAPILSGREASPRERALYSALRGETVATDSLSETISVLDFSSPVGLVRYWQNESVVGTDTPPRRFAADSVEVERFIRRLGRETEAGPVDLAQLPIGSFLLAIHDCIKTLPGGGIEVVLESDAVLDIAESGFLDDGGADVVSAASASVMRRVLPFFAGCRTGTEWSVRAEHLYKLIVAEVQPLGAKLAQGTDLERIYSAVDNPLRLVPWADLQVSEAASVRLTIEKIFTLVSEMASRERVALKDHMRFLQRELAAGMQGLPESDRREIESKVQGFSVGLEDEIDVEGLVDIVELLLGRTATLDLFDEPDRTSSHVSELRGLDALGMHRLEQDLHIANLADSKFPTVVPSVGWPFRLEDLSTSGITEAEAAPIQEIVRLRFETASLSDLYLLWLAISGVGEANRVTFSWISELGGEKQNLSPLVSLLTLPQRGEDAVKARAGGVEVTRVRPIALGVGSVSRPERAASTTSAEEAARAALVVDSRAAASALACSRRFALQWMLGQSHAFQAAHHHALLYGNMIGALVKLKKASFVEAQRTVTDLWRFMTPGQRRSSLAMRRVHPFRASAHALWTLTLAGSKDGTEPLDYAYQSAYKAGPVPSTAFVPAESDFLPPGVDDHAICGACPVRASCSSSR